MSLFPALNYSKITTRRGISIHELSQLMLYKDDSDADDLADYYIENGKLPINYKLIVLVLLYRYYNTNDIWIELTKILKEILNEISEKEVENRSAKRRKSDELSLKRRKSDELSLNTLLNDVKNVTVEYYRLCWSVPTASSLNLTDTMTLYSGVRSYKMIMIKELEKLETNAKWLSPTFISTSVRTNTPLRFQDPNDRVLLKFEVPPNKLKNFKYISLSLKKVEFPQTFYDATMENDEFLLPPFCSFTYEKKTQETLSYYDFDTNLKTYETTANTTVYYLTFESFCNKTPEQLQIELNDLRAPALETSSLNRKIIINKKQIKKRKKTKRKYKKKKQTKKRKQTKRRYK